MNAVESDKMARIAIQESFLLSLSDDERETFKNAEKNLENAVEAGKGYEWNHGESALMKKFDQFQKEWALNN